jgi:hypothetical protein
MAASRARTDDTDRHRQKDRAHRAHLSGVEQPPS